MADFDYDNGSTVLADTTTFKFETHTIDYPQASNYDGIASLNGTAILKGEPIMNATVILYENETHTKIAETKTDDDGRFNFTGINSKRKYDVVVKDPDGNWEDRVQSRITPIII